MNRKTFGILGCFFTTFAFAGLVDSKTEIERDLRRFKAVPWEFMNTPPKKWNAATGERILSTVTAFPEKMVFDRSFVDAKWEWDFFRAVLNTNKNGRSSRSAPTLGAPIGAGDQPSNLVEELKFITLESMEQAKLKEAALKEAPWSGDYWPIYAGVLARRYADSNFPDSITWKENFDFVMSSLGKASSIETLAPSEKYDIVMGDRNFTLTKAMLEEGRRYADRDGNVETWMGICHGWAPASYKVRRPQKKIEVMSSDGRTMVPFYPDDIKALATLLWANGNYNQKFIGQRCNKKDPKTDAETGRVLDKECFDTNPATWHMSIVNQLGYKKMGFVMDATFDYQVWNQPVYKYSYTYFNPKTDEQVDTISKAKLDLRDYAEDKFKKYRSSSAKWIVGVAMDVTYMSEISASAKETDGPGDDNLDTVRYYYDLELDSSGRIIGGEWYTNLHPDFLWSPTRDASARSQMDASLEQNYPDLRWDGSVPTPAVWQKAAQQASADAQPLGKVVETLIVLSQLGI